MGLGPWEGCRRENLGNQQAPPPQQQAPAGGVGPTRTTTAHEAAGCGVAAQAAAPDLRCQLIHRRHQVEIDLGLGKEGGHQADVGEV